MSVHLLFPHFPVENVESICARRESICSKYMPEQILTSGRANTLVFAPSICTSRILEQILAQVKGHERPLSLVREAEICTWALKNGF